MRLCDRETVYGSIGACLVSGGDRLETRLGFIYILVFPKVFLDLDRSFLILVSREAIQTTCFYTFVHLSKGDKLESHQRRRASSEVHSRSHQIVPSMHCNDQKRK